ncbi:MAG: hypothetical protein ACYSUU_06650, partial [Planctomycetota bacterium]
MSAAESPSEHANTPPAASPPLAIGSAPPTDRLSTRATLRRCVLWIVIAHVAGTTSFMLGFTADDASPIAMLLGIVIYGCFIGLVSSSRGFRRRLRRPFADRSFRIGYGIRLAVCVVPGA